jgi:hypothetical protein
MRLWSGNIKLLSALIAGSVLFSVACQVATKHGDAEAPSRVDAPLVDEKYSLTSDRKELDELRKNIPEEKKKENDELAFLSQLFADQSKSPSQIREKFDSLLRKKRDLFQKDMSKARETFVKDERKRREAFNKEQEEARNDFKKHKSSREQNSEFYSNLDGKRKDFSAAEREKRDEFESDMRDKRKNFEDYARERSSEFNQELRAYTKTYDELQKAK